MINNSLGNVIVETKGVIKWVPIPDFDFTSPFHEVLAELIQGQDIDSVLLSDPRERSDIYLIHSDLARFVEEAASLLSLLVGQKEINVD
jgi:hypothetical protein